eukprot:2728115-Amphidinium_carterae.1
MILPITSARSPLCNTFRGKTPNEREGMHNGSGEAIPRGGRQEDCQVLPSCVRWGLTRTGCCGTPDITCAVPGALSNFAVPDAFLARDAGG